MSNYIYMMTPTGREFPSMVTRVEVVENNQLRCRIRIEGRVYDTGWAQTLTITAGDSRVLIENEIDWTEARWVRIQQVFTWDGDGETIRYGVPFGSVRYPETMSESTEHQPDEAPSRFAAHMRIAQQWIDIGQEELGITIGTDHRTWEFEGKTARSHMIRGAGHCRGIERDGDGTPHNIPRPPPGRYRFRYSLSPRRGSMDAVKSYRSGWELNHPLHAVSSSGCRPGSAPADRISFLDCSESPLVVSAFKLAEDEDAVVGRFFDAEGHGWIPGQMTIAGKEPRRCSLVECPDDAPADIRPNGIATFIWALDGHRTDGRDQDGT